MYLLPVLLLLQQLQQNASMHRTPGGPGWNKASLQQYGFSDSSAACKLAGVFFRFLYLFGRIGPLRHGVDLNSVLMIVLLPSAGRHVLLKDSS